MDKAVRKVDGTPWGSLFSLMAAVFYGVSPIDIIPDVIFGFGLDGRCGGGTDVSDVCVGALFTASEGDADAAPAGLGG